MDPLRLDLHAEIERLRDAKRRALAIADERGKEAAALRAALKRVDGLNDNPARYNADIDAVLRALEQGGGTGVHPVSAFTAAILHGDSEHRQWLREAADDFICGRPVRREHEQSSHTRSPPEWPTKMTGPPDGDGV